MAGLRDDAWKAHADIEYTDEEFHDQNSFNGRWISKHTKVFLAEDEPYLEGEDETFNRPIMLSARRRKADECIEGDYLDTHIADWKGDLIGWIEVSGTKDGKFPDGNAIRWIELVASLLAVAIDRERKGEERDERSGSDKRRIR